MQLRLMTTLTLTPDSFTSSPCSRPGVIAVTQGACVYRMGATGSAWRVVRGSVRLDSLTPDGEQLFANLAVAGDVIGAETMIFGHYSFEATALAATELEPWPSSDVAEKQNVQQCLLETLAKSERQVADVMALRGGEAQTRVMHLIRLLQGRSVLSNVQRDSDIELPPRKDIAEMTALTIETVSRCISRFKQNGLLIPLLKRGRPVLNRFIVK